MNLLRPDDPRALAWVTARDRQGSAQPEWRPCSHAPVALVREPGRTYHVRLPSGAVRSVEEEGAVWCPLCGSPEQVQAAVLRWVRHGLVSSWNVATELGIPLRVAGRALGWLYQAGRVERVDQIRLRVDGVEVVVGLWRAA